MKLSLPRNRVSRAQSGMTLVEVLIAAALFMVIIGGLLAAHILGLREDQLMETKAGANDSSRWAVNQLLQDIRSARGYNIGSAWDGVNFTAITNGNFQGPDLQLYTVILSSNQMVNTTNFIIYNFDLSQIANNNGMLWRTVISNGITATNLVTSNLINSLWFTSENYQGYTQTVKTYKGVVHTTLQFSEFLYPLTQVGSNCLYNYYRIDCRATPHLPDGP